MYPENVVERFWAKVNKETPSGCWEFGGAKIKNGYGQLGVGGYKLKMAHRFSWEIHNGPIPDGLLVCHTCDNRVCVRPDHLFVGTHKDNTLDMLQKGRGRKARGEDHWSTSLTAAQVREIRGLLAAGDCTPAQLAQMFGVGRSTIYHIRSGRTWKHVE